MNKTMMKTLCALAMGANLVQASARTGDVAATADITFKGSSTLHGFEGTATSQPFIATLGKDEKTGQLRVSAKTTLNIRTMTTNNKKRDKNMFKMFDLEHFSTIDGTLEETLVSVKESATGTLHLKIHGNEHDVAATISNIRIEENLVSCTMEFPVSLKAFGLAPPSVMGVIRVDDTVHVECTVEGRIKNTATEG